METICHMRGHNYTGLGSVPTRAAPCSAVQQVVQGTLASQHCACAMEERVPRLKESLDVNCFLMFRLVKSTFLKS